MIERQKALMPIREKIGQLADDITESASRALRSSDLEKRAFQIVTQAAQQLRDLANGKE